MSQSNSTRQRSYRQKRGQKGDRRLTIWLSQQACSRLDKMVTEEDYRHLGIEEARTRIFNDALSKLDSERFWTRKNQKRY